MTFNAATLIAAFRKGGAWLDDALMDLVPVEGMGIGALAKRAIEPHTPLFHIPPSYLLTPWTSALRTHLSAAEWAALEGGWARLILCMMWEESRADSPWGGYLANMPRVFDSPMFWDEGDRAALRGTDIADRIGREDAEEEYRTKLAPLIASRADLFPAESGCFSLEAFHVQGSRILSRSFTIPITRAGGPAPEGEDEEEEDEEEEEVAVMVPMADMLNAAYERDNARLYADGEDDDEDGDAAAREKAKRFGEGYTMITTKPIAAGEQIYNTYASPPNSELLRKYGHVDALPLPSSLLQLLTPDEIGEYPLGNMGDEAEVAGDLVVDAAVAAGLSRDGADGAAARVDWWLDEGQPDAFPLTFPAPEDDEDGIPAALWAFARLLTRDEDWERAKRGKLPKPKNDDPASVKIVLEAVRARAGRYLTTLAADLETVCSAGPAGPAGSAGLNARNAAAVRIGERRVLALAERTLSALAKSEKRKGKGEDKARGGKRRK